MAGVLTTRREVITSSLGLAGIIAAGKAPAAFVRSMAAARGMSFCGETMREVEYLESTGTQYIDTEISLSSNLACDVFVTNSDIGNYVVFGGRIDTGHYSFSIWSVLIASRNIRFDYIDSIGIGGLVYGPTVSQGVEYRIIKNTVRNIVDGVDYDNSKSGDEWSCGLNAYLFAMNNNGVASFNLKGRISSALVYKKEGGSLVLKRQFIPARVGDVGYMYDRVTGKLFGNAGTGAFIVGPDK